jgi:hypothetical protein
MVKENGNLVNIADIFDRKQIGAATVLTLTVSSDISLGADTTSVDIYVDGIDVYMGFAENPTAETAPYKLKNGNQYSLSVNPTDALHLYFAPTTGSFSAGQYIRIQEWS